MRRPPNRAETAAVLNALTKIVIEAVEREMTVSLPLRGRIVRGCAEAWRLMGKEAETAEPAEFVPRFMERALGIAAMMAPAAAEEGGKEG